MAGLGEVTTFAFAAHDVVLDKNQIAFFKSFAPGELAAGFGDVADILVAHDHGSLGRRRLVHLDVSSADAADFHLEQSAIGRTIRHGAIANLRFVRTNPYRRYD